jgi:glycosyltransferase involved in cell wall biosynthesis
MDVVSFWLVILSLLLFIGYAALIAYYQKGWRRSPEFLLQENFTPHLKVAVIVPARNEEKNIGACLHSLIDQTYPKALLEIIVIDDHSTDESAEIVKEFTDQNVKLISLRDHLEQEINSYKKKAIEIAIDSTNADWIITTDADSTASPLWIETMMAFKDASGGELIAAPVKLSAKGNLLEIFQMLDFITLQGITAAAVNRNFHVMGNGANLGYSKKSFIEVEGFKGIDSLASGDDMLLMQKIKIKYPEKIFYLKNKDAIIRVAPAQSWREFWHQRIRWASKADKYQDKKIFWVLMLVYVFNFLLLGLFILCFWNPDLLLVVLVLFLCKTLVEFPFVNEVAGFFGERKRMFYFIFIQPLHIIYTVVAGFLGKFGKYEWKGRVVK